MAEMRSGTTGLRTPLSEREQEILTLMAEGLSNHEIAQSLFLTYGTVKWYSGQIYSKLGVNNRVQAIAQIDRLRLFEPADARNVLSPNLPMPLTVFVGRDRELLELKQLLATNRLVTLTGPAGSGKTRLALEVAANVRHAFAEGGVFVDLAPVSRPSLVASAIAHALDITEHPDFPLSDTLKHALADRELLVVLDNFEHVIDAALLLPDLLSAAPHLTFLATSREALRLTSEQAYPVQPLSLPSSDSPAALADSEATSLFIRRVQMMLPHFAVSEDNAPAIAQICTRLDGLPLAIELAAARCKLLSPQALLERLSSRLGALTSGPRDLPARQQTLRHTLDWSYDLLNQDEQLLFARLAVFRGGRSLEAIEAVCAEEFPGDLFDTLTSLLDKNLIYRKDSDAGEPRFWMLETIHEYARECLAESSGAETIHRRYAQYFVELTERAEPELRLAEHRRWSQRLELEIYNLRAVLEWTLGEGNVTLGVRLAGALHLFWWAYGYHVEGRRWIQPLLERLDEVPTRYHAKFLFSAGLVAIMQHDLDAAKHLLMRSLAIARMLDDKHFTGWALIYLGFAMLQEPEEALPAVEEGLALFRELDYHPGIAQALNIIGNIATGLGDYDHAQRSYAECLTVAQQTGETRQICHMFHNLAFLALHQADYERAGDAAHHALDLALAMNNPLLVVLSLTILAAPMGWKGQPQRAVRLLGAAAAVLEGMGAFYQPIDQPEIDRIVTVLRHQLDDTAFQAAWAEGRTMSLEQAIAEALVD